MIRLLRLLLTGDWHLHKWRIIEETQYRDSLSGSEWTRRYCQCEHCGTIKVFDV